MIISRTPFRISFLGGGTDLPSFYQEEEGAVLSTTIDKYMYITVNDRFDDTYRLAYSKTEICKTVEEIEHPIFSTILKRYAGFSKEKNGGRGLELLSMADIPSGTGLGSSSSFTVGLLHAMKAHVGEFQSAENLAQEASEIEIEELKEPIGKQDQYAAAFGGLSYIRFQPSGKVSVEPVICNEKSKQDLEQSIMLFYTGITRSASKILIEQTGDSKREIKRQMKQLATRMKQALEKNDRIEIIAELLHEGWQLKKSLSNSVSDAKINEWYERARTAGAWSGKLLGAGGGGFLMLLCHPEMQTQVRAELKELRELKVRFDTWGSKIIFVG